MNAQGIASLLGETLETGTLTYEAFDLEQVKKDLKEKGYSIVHDLVPERTRTPIRDFWLKKFSEPNEGRVTWSPYLGQLNHVGFSSDAFQHLSRSCDFLWNTPFHKETRAFGLQMNALRNVVLGHTVSHGTLYSPDRYGIFITASYYQPEVGFMDAHDDGVREGDTLIHCLAPFTYRGIDYASGGMHLVDRDGVFVDVDGILKPGDAVFYDGSLVHGVAPIVPLVGKSTGRLQLSPFPTLFTDLRTNPRALNTISFSEFLGAKWACLKNDVRIRLGMRPGMR